MTPKDFIQTWFANIDAKKFDELRNMMADDHQFNNPMTPAPADKETHLGMIQMMTGSFDGHHEIDVMLGDGDRACARGRFIGKHTGAFNGIPATGKQIEFSWIDILHVVNGKLKEEYFEMNPMAIMQQIGAMPA